MISNCVFALDVSLLSDPAIFEKYYMKQRQERRERIDRMRYDGGKRLCLGAGVVMERALVSAGCEDKKIVITPEGKPTVEGCFFNVSHTDGIAVCAVSDREVGIDVERPRKMTDAVIDRAFTPSEKQMVAGDKDRFIRLWTIKESVMKWYGLGLGLMPENIDITMGDDISVSVSGHPELSTPAEELRITTYRHEDYRITVCSTYESFTESITWIDLN